MRTVGVDLAAEPDNTASATLEWGPSGATVTEVIVGVTDEQILAAADWAAKVGIDCPFGWPLPFHRLLTERNYTEIEPESLLEQFLDATGWFLLDEQVEVTPAIAARVALEMQDPRSRHYRNMRKQNMPAQHLVGPQHELGHRDRRDLISTPHAQHHAI